MANIQRAVLVESPPATAYQVWKDIESYPSFFEGIAGIAPIQEGAYTWRSHEDAGGDLTRVMRIVEDEAPYRLHWRNEGAPERDCLVTFAPLEGDACWMVFKMELDTGDAGEDQAEVLSRAGRRLQCTLLNARKRIEAAYRDGTSSQLRADVHRWR